MSTNLTYTTLESDLGAYLEKARAATSTAYAQIPRIVDLSQRAVVDELKLQGYEKTLRGYMTEGVSVYPKPDRWRETISMMIEKPNGTIKYLYPRAYEYCRRFWPNSSLTGEPKFYADHETTHWLMAKTPDLAYPWEIKCYLMPVLIGPSVQTNMLTEYYPNVLLMRSLKEMALFLKKYDEAAAFEAEYGKAISAVATQDSKKIMDRAAERDGV